jgi:hypothetical protein
LDHGDLHLLLGRQLATIAARNSCPLAIKSCEGFAKPAIHVFVICQCQVLANFLETFFRDPTALPSVSAPPTIRHLSRVTHLRHANPTNPFRRSSPVRSIWKKAAAMTMTRATASAAYPTTSSDPVVLSWLFVLSFPSQGRIQAPY